MFELCITCENKEKHCILDSKNVVFENDILIKCPLRKNIKGLERIIDKQRMDLSADE